MPKKKWGALSATRRRGARSAQLPIQVGSSLAAGSLTTRAWLLWILETPTDTVGPVKIADLLEALSQLAEINDRQYTGDEDEDVETEAAETQVWLEFAVKCGCVGPDEGRTLYTTYDDILRTIVGMINHPETWVLR